MGSRESVVSLRTWPLPLKLLATCYLLTVGVGYLFAVTYLYMMDVEPHRKQNLGVLQDIIVTFYGNRDHSRIESAVDGPMQGYVDPSEKTRLLRWVHGGAPQAQFDSTVVPIFKQTCWECHGPQPLGGAPSLVTYADLTPYVAIDTGAPLEDLVQTSHVHLFGMGFLFALVSLVFAFSEAPVWFRSVFIVAPFAAIWIDIGSWWFTKEVAPLFATTVIAGGVLMALSFAVQIAVSLYDLWLARRHPAPRG